MNPSKFSPHTIAVFESIARYTPDGGVTRQTLIALHGDTLGEDKVVFAIQNLRQNTFIKNVGSPTTKGARYVINAARMSDKPALMAIDTAKQVFTSSKAYPSSGVGYVEKRPPYDGAELKLFDGRPGANDHMQFGSIVNGKPVPYTKPRLQRTA